MHARKNVIAIIKKIASKLFVVILLASVFIGILTVIPEEVRAQTKESLPSSVTFIESTKDYSAEESIRTPLINPEYLKELTLAYPSSPQNLKSSPGDGYVVLSWAAPSSDGGSAITEYRIYRGTSYGKEVLLDSVTAPRTLYKDTAVKNGQTYYYKVSAVNKEEEGTSASTKATPTSSVTTPSAPRNLIATAGDRVVSLNWNAPVDDGGSAITEYTIYRGTSSDAESYLYSVSAPTTSYTDRTVTNDLIYYYKVSAENSVGEGEKSNEVDAKPKSSLTEPTVPIVTTPSAPLNFKVSAGDGNVNLEWTEPSDDGGSLITNYNIYRATTSGWETRLETVSNVLSYKDDDVINNQRYYYQVSAVNSAGEGERSDEASATLIPGVTAPSAPRNLKATASDRVVNLNWHVPVDDGGSTITEYQIYRGTSSDAESYLDSVSAPTTSYTDRTVTNDLIYYYKVSAENSVGEGEKSNEASATQTSDVTTPTATSLSDPSALASSTTPTSDVTTPTAPQTSAGTSPLDSNWMITLIVALIGALGVIAAALINYLSSKNKK